MTIEDELKLQIGAYYGVMSMDNYDLKEFVLKDIEEYINCFVQENNIVNLKDKMEQYKDELSLKTKLQDSLIILNRINASIELVLLIKNKIKEID